MGCKGEFATEEGPKHAYMESTPGCWAAYGRVLVREYENRRFFTVNSTTVDTYAVQHPGIPSQQSIQSVGVHLVRLYLLLERGLPPDKANDAMLSAAKRKSQYFRLEPPVSRGALTVADVEASAGLDGYRTAVRNWAEQTWRSWSKHHAVIQSWADVAQRVAAADSPPFEGSCP